MKIALAGIGFMGGVHLSAIERLDSATLAAVASRSRPVPGAPARGNLAHARSAEIPASAAWYPDWRQLLTDPAIDAIDICLPTQLHKEVALSAFASGKHVLLEKPMALNIEDCAEIMQAARNSGRIFMVAQVLRFMFPYQFAARFVREHRVSACTMYRKAGYPQWSEWLAKTENSGGAILDLLSHDIDQALSFFGPPVSVTAISDGEVDTMRGTLRFADGLEVHIDGGWFTPEVPFSAGFHITAPDASLTLEAGKLYLTRDGAQEPVQIPEHDEYLDQMAYFVDCCRTGTPPTLCPPSESANAVRIANLLKLSRDQNGKEIPCEL